MDKKLAFRTMRGRVGWILFFVVVGGGAAASFGGEGRKKLVSDDVLYRMDDASPSITQPVESGDGSSGKYKFVEIEVSEVRNPNKTPLIFQVYFQPNSREKVHLGSFSLYPADNPGTFIVATQGKVKADGAIIVSVVIPDRVEPRDAVRVTVKKIRLH